MLSTMAKHMIKFVNTEVLSELRIMTKRTRKLARMPKLQTVTVTIVDRGIGDYRVLLPSVVFKMNTESSKVLLLFIFPVILTHSLHTDSTRKVLDPCNIFNKVINLVACM